MSEYQMMCPKCDIAMVKQHTIRCAVIPVGNNQTEAIMSEDWYRCAGCGHERGFLDRRIA
jgi:hypothetical protein